MEEETGFNGFTPSDYANELYMDAKVNAQRRDRLQRRLDKLKGYSRLESNTMKQGQSIAIIWRKAKLLQSSRYGRIFYWMIGLETVTYNESKSRKSKEK